MPRLLVVDDEESVLYSLEQGLQTSGLEILTADTAKRGIKKVRDHAPDAVILDVRLPDMSGLDAYSLIREIDPRLPVIIITAYAATETAIEAMKRGAFEYLLKPLDLHQLRDVVARALELSRLSRVPATFDAGDAKDSDAVEPLEADRIVGRSPVMQEIYKAIGRVAPQDVTVLVLGESGTGKELIVRSIYQHSERARGPFLAINCAAIPEPLLESELFGHERGAFTGADRRRVGKFEQADGGTIFLDEIGDMPPAIQAKVLRLLQEQEFERLGGNDTIRTDVRVIAATNRNLEELVRDGGFRSDLFYRLNVFTLHVPPLRERLDDLPLLIEYFMRRLGRDLGKSARTISPEAMELLERHTWPGNVRELQSTIKYALVQATGDVVTADCLPDAVRPAIDPPQGASPSGDEALDVGGYIDGLLSQGQPDVYHAVHSAVDRVLLEKVLEHVDGNQVEASELLGVSRNTLRSKLKALGLTVEKKASLRERKKPRGS